MIIMNELYLVLGGKNNGSIVFVSQQNKNNNLQSLGQYNKPIGVPS